MRVCQQCGNEIKGNGKRFCSKECYTTSTRTLIGTVKACVVCANNFEPRYKGQRCCGDECSKKAADQTKRERAKLLNAVVKICARCGKEYHPRLYHAGQQIYCEECIAFKDRDKCRRRRAEMRGATAERINDHEVFERDGWVCQICKKKVNQRFKWPHLKSPSLDHIKPLSVGGSHVYTNVQLAHLGCNISKNASGGGQLKLFGKL